MKRYSTTYVIRNMYIKTTVYLLKCPKSGTLTTPNDGDDVEKQKLSFAAGRNAEW